MYYLDKINHMQRRFKTEDLFIVNIVHYGCVFIMVTLFLYCLMNERSIELFFRK